ncbi:MAG: cell division protein ZapA [Firmicutes bacterium]|jgi:cell division protein ZapA|nr:cell division protein ZapA [Bacillota bacterium]
MSQERKNRVHVKIYHEEYTMCSQASPEYMKRIAQYVDEKMRQLGEKNTRLGTSKIAVLAAVNLADELFRLRREMRELEARLNRKNVK